MFESSPRLLWGNDSQHDLRILCLNGLVQPPTTQWDFQGPPIMGPPYGKLPIRIPRDMGIVWEAYRKGVPLSGVPGITLELL